MRNTGEWGVTEGLGGPKSKRARSEQQQEFSGLRALAVSRPWARRWAHTHSPILTPSPHCPVQPLPCSWLTPATRDGLLTLCHLPAYLGPGSHSRVSARVSHSLTPPGSPHAGGIRLRPLQRGRLGHLSWQRVWPQNRQVWTIQSSTGRVFTQRTGAGSRPGAGRVISAGGHAGFGPGNLPG